VSWKDVTADTAPNLYRFGKQASTADLVVRTINETTCPTEGWLTLGAGQRTIDDAPACRPPKARSRWTELVEVNSASKYHARLGRLGKALRNAKTTAIGPGAAMALTDPKGRLRADYADLAPIPGSVRGTSAGAADDSGAAAKAYLEKAAGSKVTVVDLGAVRRPESQLSASGGGRPGFWRRLGGFFASEPSASRDVTAQISALDARFASLLRAIREKDPKATVLAASLADSQSSRPSLGYFAAAGPRTRAASTWASKRAVKCEFGRTSQGTGTVLTPCSGQSVRGTAQCTWVLNCQMSRWRHARLRVSCTPQVTPHSGQGIARPRLLATLTWSSSGPPSTSSNQVSETSQASPSPISRQGPTPSPAPSWTAR